MIREAGPFALREEVCGNYLSDLRQNLCWRGIAAEESCFDEGAFDLLDLLPLADRLADGSCVGVGFWHFWPSQGEVEELLAPVNGCSVVFRRRRVKRYSPTKCSGWTSGEEVGACTKSGGSDFVPPRPPDPELLPPSCWQCCLPDLVVGCASGVRNSSTRGLVGAGRVVLVLVVECWASVWVLVLALSCIPPSATVRRISNMFVSHGTDQAFETVRLLRIPAGSSARVTVQSETVEVVRTHWFGRQYACPGDGCPACECYQSRLTCFVVVTVFTGKVWVPNLLELTPAELSRVRFMLEWDAGEIVPGVVLHVSRKSARSGVRVEPQDVEGGQVLRSLSSREVLFNSVCRLLALPSAKDGEVQSAWTERVRPFLVSRLQLAIEKMG